MQQDNGDLKALDKEELMQEICKGNKGLIFTVGEKVKIKEGDFRIKSFGKKIMVLEGLPGTRIKT